MNQITYTVIAAGECSVDLIVKRNDVRVFRKSLNKLDLPLKYSFFGNFVANDSERLQMLFDIAHKQGKEMVRTISKNENQGKSAVDKIVRDAMEAVDEDYVAANYKMQIAMYDKYIEKAKKNPHLPVVIDEELLTLAKLFERKAIYERKLELRNMK